MIRRFHPSICPDYNRVFVQILAEYLDLIKNALLQCLTHLMNIDFATIIHIRRIYGV